MVNLIDCSRAEFISQVKEKKLYCFGAGKFLQHFIDSDYGVSVEAVIDNYRNTEDKPVYIGEKAVRIISADEFAERCDRDCAVIITCFSIDEILKQLDLMRQCDGVDCYVQFFIEQCLEHTKIDLKDKPHKAVIPKKIHYCWFGGQEIPDEYQKYIATWKKFCPDYELIRWDESNYDVYKNRYVREAYERKKWAFVADYARVDILYREGGIYFDTDVEVIAPFDEFLVWDLFCGFEQSDYIAWGLGIGAVKGHPILKSVLEVYEKMSFIKEDGSYNMKTCPVIQSEIMEQYGFQRNGQFQSRHGVAVFPWEFFAPMHESGYFGRVTEYSHSIHHYAASWVGSEDLANKRKYQEWVKKIKEHNRSGISDEYYEEYNRTGSVKKFQIWECLPSTDTAGSKAPADVKKIFGSKGYQVIEIRPRQGQEQTWSDKRNIDDWNHCYELIPEGSILLLQHPFWQEQKERNEVLKKLKSDKHVKIISLVHDVEKLRVNFISNYMNAEYRFMLQIADVLIVHNEKMKQVFLEEGVEEEKIISLGIFDYLLDGEWKAGGTGDFEKSICIAGNLNPVKSPYISRLSELVPLKVHLYGPNYAYVNMTGETFDNIAYHGIFSADQIPGRLKGDFGLVWDGECLDTCTGNTGQYLKYNNPHKLSLYLAAGMPVVIWKEAAEAEFVEKNGVGFAVDSLYEINNILEDMDEEQYSRYLTAVEKIAPGIREGRNTGKAIEKAEMLLGL